MTCILEVWFLELLDYHPSDMSIEEAVKEGIDEAKELLECAQT